MINFMLSVFLIGSPRVTVKTVPQNAIKIDGVVDEVWATADSVDSMTQYRPYYNRKATWKTVFKFLQDKSNLYVLVVAYTDGEHPAASLSGRTDDISVFIDPIGDRTTCYEFEVSADGRYNDSFFFNDGTDEDHGWDGFWFYEVKVYEHKYVIEIKIPFRTIRFRRGLNSWGLQLERNIPQLHETDFWILPSQEHGFRVSIFGSLDGVNPEVEGHGMEFYPVGFLRNDYYDGKYHLNPGGGLDFSYALSSNTQLNLTINPDFAQIESDPYAMNLSKYEMWLPEMRPFFVEARDVFRLSALRNSEFIRSPVIPFYSRRIGRKLPDGTEVPITLGSKITSRGENMDYGFMLVKTERKRYTYGEEEYVEPGYLWNIARFNFRLGQSGFGFYYGNRISDSAGVESANLIAVDGSIRNESNELVYQLFRSNVGGRVGKAWFIAADHAKNDWIFSTNIYAIGENFDPTPIGRFSSALPGDTSIGFSQGHTIRFSEGQIHHIWLGVGEQISKEAGEPWCKGVGLYGGISFRNGYGGHLHIRLAEGYEYGQKKPTISYGMEFNRWGSNFRFGVGVNMWKGWNYNRWYSAGNSYIPMYGWMMSPDAWLSFPITDRMSFRFSSNSWVEFDTTNSFMAITTRLSPSVNYAFGPHLNLNISTEVAVRRDKTSDDRDIQSGAIVDSRLGINLTYNFRPKSRLYVVLNLHGVRPDDADSPFAIVQDFGVAAVKVRWAIPF